MTEHITLGQFRQLQKSRLMKRSKKREPSKGEELFAQQLKAYGIPFEREKRIHPIRMWRVDFFLTDTSYAVEIEGGIYAKHSKSRHTTCKGFEEDCIKYAEAALRGIRVLRFTPQQVKRGIAIAYAKRAVGIVM